MQVTFWILFVPFWTACSPQPVPYGPQRGEDSAEQNTSALDSTDSDSSDSHNSDSDTFLQDTGSHPILPVCSSYGTAEQLGTVQSLDLSEISGLAVSRRYRDILYVLEDHLGQPAVYALNPAGELLVTIHLTGATNNDWEDLALAPCGDQDCLWVGEIGNNDLDRTGMGVYRFPEPDLEAAANAEISTGWDFFGYVYPDQNQNAEALAITSSGTPIIFTKRYDNATSNAYQFPSMTPGTEVPLLSLGSFATGLPDAGPAGALTAADLWPDDHRAIFRTYGSVFEIDLSGGLGTIDQAVKTDLISAPEKGGGEAIAYDGTQRGYWQIAEGPNPGVWFTGCADGL